MSYWGTSLYINPTPGPLTRPSSRLPAELPDTALHDGAAQETPPSPPPHWNHIGPGGAGWKKVGCVGRGARTCSSCLCLYETAIKDIVILFSSASCTLISQTRRGWALPSEAMKNDSLKTSPFLCLYGFALVGWCQCCGPTGGDVWLSSGPAPPSRWPDPRM